MPSGYNLPHIDITGLGSAQTYAGEGFPNNSAVRIRDEHGRQIQNELEFAFAAADRTRPTDERLDAPTGAFLKVRVAPGRLPADTLDLKSQDIRTGATKANEANERTVALYRSGSRSACSRSNP